MARFLVFSAFVVFPFLLKAQAAGLYLYKGAVDKRPVTFLLRAEISACNGDTAWSGMYRYDGVSKWLFVHVEANTQN